MHLHVECTAFVHGRLNPTPVQVFDKFSLETEGCDEAGMHCTLAAFAIAQKNTEKYMFKRQENVCFLLLRQGKVR